MTEKEAQERASDHRFIQGFLWAECSCGWCSVICAHQECNELFAEHLADQPSPQKKETKMNETREQKADRLVKESGKTVHSNDCATSVAPAEEPGPCDCDAAPQTSDREEGKK